MFPESALVRQLLIGSAMALGTALISYRLKFLTAGGAAGAFVLGAIIFGLGGWKWAVPMLVFFISSSLLSKMGRTRKAHYDSIFEKGDTRDIGQTLANGAVAALIILAALFQPDVALVSDFSWNRIRRRGGYLGQ